MPLEACYSSGIGRSCARPLVMIALGYWLMTSSSSPSFAQNDEYDYDGYGGGYYNSDDSISQADDSNSEESVEIIENYAGNAPDSLNTESLEQNQQFTNNNNLGSIPSFDGGTIDEDPYGDGYNDDEESNLFNKQGTYNLYDDPEPIIEENPMTETTNSETITETPTPATEPENSYREKSEKDDTYYGNANQDQPLTLPHIQLDPAHSKTPPIQDTLGILGPGDAPKYYVIQEGDSLYDICDQFLDEPEYWPKLWSLNPEIKNPHYVWPGMILRFYPGDDFLPPFLEIQHEESLEPVSITEDFTPEDLVKAPLAYDDDGDGIPDPPKSMFPEMLDRSIWNSLPNFPVNQSSTARVQQNIYIPLFVEDSWIKPTATIIGSFLDGYSIHHTGSLVSATSIAVGSKHSVVRFSHKIRDPLTGKFLGFMYRNIADIVIKETHDDLARKARENFYRSGSNIIKFLQHRVSSTSVYSVERLNGVIKRGDLVVARKSKMINVPTMGNVNASPIDATVVSFGDGSQKFGHTTHFVVLNNPSLQQGQSVNFYQDRKQIESLADTNIFKKAGAAVIVGSSNNTATAYITHSQTAIHIGDRCAP
ncbi:MAG: LysM peptidoglycan-binding domain-containing protein [Proteobacteria bacterium]|nr:LysM peptidoglycan-binding domain-containing protein [Pseudomonadota bacterium]